MHWLGELAHSALNFIAGLSMLLFMYLAGAALILGIPTFFSKQLQREFFSKENVQGMCFGCGFTVIALAVFCIFHVAPFNLVGQHLVCTRCHHGIKEVFCRTCGAVYMVKDGLPWSTKEEGETIEPIE
jgi:hypothetical protein